MNNLEFKNVQEFEQAQKNFFATHPEAPKVKEVECLNLIMRKEFAQQILAGTKKLEYRAYSPHYVSRLIDKDMADYIQRHVNDPEVTTFCNDIRPVMKIHFHNYSNSWYLDVECTYNDAFILDKNGVEYLQKEFGVHEWDDELARLDAQGAEFRPCMFFFEVGEILGTNLK